MGSLLDHLRWKRLQWKVRSAVVPQKMPSMLRVGGMRRRPLKLSRPWSAQAQALGLAHPCTFLDRAPTPPMYVQGPGQPGPQPLTSIGQTPLFYWLTPTSIGQIPHLSQSRLAQIHSWPKSWIGPAPIWDKSKALRDKSSACTGKYRNQIVMASFSASMMSGDPKNT